MLNIYIYIITAVVLGFCTAVVLHQAIYSMYFRKKIATPHDFSEGILTGLPYPMLWITYGLIAVQFISFIAFHTENELTLTLRLIVFALSVLAFCIFKSLTPPLLAYWFAAHAFWDNHGEQGKHLYSDMYCAKVHKDKNSDVINNQQIYKLTFYIKGRTFFLLPKRFACKMTASEISELGKRVNLKDRSAKPIIPKKALLYSTCAPLLILGITLCVFFHTVSTGILNAEKYSSADTALTEPIETVTEISEVLSDGANIYVYYERIGAVNVYGADGEFIYSVSLPHSLFRHGDIALHNGNLVFKSGSSVTTYSAEGNLILTEPYSNAHKAIFDSNSGSASVSFDKKGVHLDGSTVLKLPAYSALFTPSLIWPINMLLIIALFVLRYFVNRPPRANKPKTKELFA